MQRLWSSYRMNNPLHHNKDDDDDHDTRHHRHHYRNNNSNSITLKDSTLTQDTATFDESFKSCRSSITFNFNHDDDDDENPYERSATTGDIDANAFHRSLTGGSYGGGKNSIHHDEKKRSHSVHSNFLRSDKSNNSKKKHGSFNGRGSYIDYLAEMDGWSLGELLNNGGGGNNDLDDEAAYNNIAAIVDAWENIARMIEEDDAVDIEMIHDALEAAKEGYLSSFECKQCVDDKLSTVVQVLTSFSEEDLLTPSDRVVVERSIRLALQYIIRDLRMKSHKFTLHCSTLEALVPLFDHKRPYYELVNPTSRMDKILSFLRIKGFYHLANYFNARCNTTLFPEWQLIHRVLVASYQCITSLRDNEDDRMDYLHRAQRESKQIVHAVMNHLRGMKLENLAHVKVKTLEVITGSLMTISQEHAISDPDSMVEYVRFCFDFIVKLLSVQSSAQSEKHKKLALELIHTLFCLVNLTRPIAYNVRGSNDIHLDGLYTISSASIDNEGYIIPSANIRYVRQVKLTERNFVLFLDNTLDIKRTWSISEEFHVDDFEGLEYMDFYTNVPDRVQYSPPLTGWMAPEDDTTTGPVLSPVETMVLIRKEHKSLSDDVVKWFVEMNLLKLVLGMDTSLFSGSYFNKTLDVFMNGIDFVSEDMSKQFSSILPKIDPRLTPDDRSSIKLAVIEATKQAVAMAKDMTDDMTRQQTALNSVNEALDFLASFERDTRSQFERETEHIIIDTGGSLFCTDPQEEPHTAKENESCECSITKQSKVEENDSFSQGFSDEMKSITSPVLVASEHSTIEQPSEELQKGSMKTKLDNFTSDGIECASSVILST